MHVPVCGKAREMIPRNQRSFASRLGEGRETLSLLLQKVVSFDSIQFDPLSENLIRSPQRKSHSISGFRNPIIPPGSDSVTDLNLGFR
ncbi:hypothetical protein F2Q70_00007520 [Brassica cretica]|uniref:Uncharacterized protein n=1 Tax=Brassica cretica TaxID=69181 RepID=A0A8S9LUN6_BRACR|nr:hypothetical protein F2Q68_00000570 [Brassica cretica]KAF2611464.1 hypothetical protein F2Q70_00007520 [Brassica cretica]